MLKPNKSRQLLAIFIVLAGVCLSVAIVVKLHQTKGPAEILKELPKNIDLSLKKIHYTEIRNGEKCWELVADKVEYDRRREYAYFRNLSMDLYGREKSGVLNVRANNAKYNSKTGDVELTGNISAGNRTGMKFTTGRLRYAAARSMISTSDKVTFNDGRLTVTGTGMEFMVRTKTVKLLNNVSASIAPR